MIDVKSSPTEDVEMEHILGFVRCQCHCDEVTQESQDRCRCSQLGACEQLARPWVRLPIDRREEKLKTACIACIGNADSYISNVRPSRVSEVNR